MEMNFNIGFLKTVQTPVFESLKQTRERLQEQIAAHDSGKNVLSLHGPNYLTDPLHKAQGALKMIGLDGVCLVIDTIEELISTVSKDKNKEIDARTHKIYQLCEVTINELLFYIEQLLNGERDRPTQLFTRLKQLKSGLNKKDLNIKDLMYPKLIFVTSPENDNLIKELKLLRFNESNLNPLLELLNNSRNKLQKLSLEVFKLLDNAKHTKNKELIHQKCKEIYEILDVLQKEKINRQFYLFFLIQKLFICILSPNFNKEFDELINKEGKLIRSTIVRIEKSIKELIDELSEIQDYNKILLLKPEQENVKEFIWAIVQSLSICPSTHQMPIYRDTIKYFDIEFYLEMLDNDNWFIKPTFLQQNPELVATLEKIYIESKEEFIVLTNKNNPDDQFISQHFTKIATLLHKFNENLQQINYPALKKLVSNIGAVSLKVKQKELPFTDLIKQEFSYAMSVLENSLQRFCKSSLSVGEGKFLDSQIELEIKRLIYAASNNKAELDKLDYPSLDRKAQLSEQKKAFAQIYQEVSNDLQQVEEVIDQFFRTDGENIEEINTLFKPLNSARGALAISGRKDLSDLVNVVSETFKKLVQEGKESVDDSVMKNCASALSGVILYLNAIKEDNLEQAETIVKNLNGIFKFFGLIKEAPKKAPKAAKPLDIIGSDEFEQTISAKVNTNNKKTTIDKADNLNSEIKNTASTTSHPNESQSIEPMLSLDMTDLTTEQNNQNKDNLNKLKLEETFNNSNISTEKTSKLGFDQPDDPELLDIYLEESVEILKQLKKLSSRLEQDLANQDVLTEIRRAYHTLKGSGRMVGLKFLGEAGWLLEQTLNKWISDGAEANKELITLINHSINLFDNWTNELTNKKEIKIDINSLLEKVKEINPTAVCTIFNELGEESEVNKDLNKETPEVITIGSEEAETSELSKENAESIISLDLINSIDFTDQSDQKNQEAEVIEEIEESTASSNSTSSIDDLLGDIIASNKDVVENIEASEENNQISEITEAIESLNPSTSKNTNKTAKISTEDDFEHVLDFGENKEDVLMVNGQEVSFTLFQIFKQESEQYIKNIVDTLELLKDVDDVHLTYEFMRYAHTLTSISRSVNLSHIAELANKVELIAQLSQDKDLTVTNKEINTLLKVAYEIPLLKKDLNFDFNNKKYNDLLKELTIIYERLLANSEKGSSSSLSPEDEMLKVFDLMTENKNKTKIKDDSFAEFDTSQPSEAVLEEEAEKDIGPYLNKFGTSILKEIENINANNNLLLSVKISELFKGLKSDLSSQFEEKFARYSEEIIREEVAAQTNILRIYLEEKENQYLESLGSVNDKLEELKAIIEKNDSESADWQKIAAQYLQVIRKELTNLSKDVKKKWIECVSRVREKISLVAAEKQLVSAADEFSNYDFSKEINEIEKISDKETVNSVDSVNKETVNQKLQENTENEEDVLIDFKDGHRLTPDEINSLTLDKLADFDKSIFNKDATFFVDIEEKPEEAPKATETEEFADADEMMIEIMSEKVSDVEDEFDENLLPIIKDEINENIVLAENILETINETLDLKKNNELKRYLHTIKGSAKMAGANKLGGIAHRIESLVDYTERQSISLFKIKEVINNEITKIKSLLTFKLYKMDIPDHYLGVLDKISFKSDKKIDKEKLESIAKDKKQKSDKRISKDLVETAPTTPVKAGKQEVIQHKQTIKVLTETIDNLYNDSSELRLTKNNIEDASLLYRGYAKDLRHASSRLQTMLKEIEIQAETQISARKDQLTESGAQFDPLEFDRFTRLQELTRFMAENVNDIIETTDNIEGLNKRQVVTLNQQSILSNGILDTLIKIRLVTVESISERLYKLVRSAAKESNKLVKLDFTGERAEIDRIVLDRLITPFEHLIRNCIAHGIETPEVRSSKKKVQAGNIIIDTANNGNFTTIKISDDGAGINLEKIKEIAIKKNLYQKNKKYSEQEILDFIFMPGFSTMDNVSQLAGRGVGMDIVKTEILSLGGTIDISTIKDKGSAFTINIPISIATTQAMLVETGGHLFAIPVIMIQDITSIKHKDLINYYHNNYLFYNMEEISLSYLGHLTGGPLPRGSLPEIKPYNKIILINHLDKRLALHVDHIYGSYDIIVKPIGKSLSKISGVIGATILGDGRQGLIVNPLLLRDHWNSLSYQREQYAIQDIDTKRTSLIMIVDDSLTVRKATTKILERNGFKVVAAKDGEDALEQLQDIIPDVILSDIEMPRMDGFELLKNIRTNEKYHGIPVIMITSRTADKHRQYAMELGANEFLGKPYQEDTLIKKINSFLTVKV